MKNRIKELAGIALVSQMLCSEASGIDAEFVSGKTVRVTVTVPPIVVGTIGYKLYYGTDSNSLDNVFDAGTNRIFQKDFPDNTNVYYAVTYLSTTSNGCPFNLPQERAFEIKDGIPNEIVAGAYVPLTNLSLFESGKSETHRYHVLEFVSLSEKRIGVTDNLVLTLNGPQTPNYFKGFIYTQDKPPARTWKKVPSFERVSSKPVDGKSWLTENMYNIPIPPLRIDPSKKVYIMEDYLRYTPARPSFIRLRD